MKMTIAYDADVTQYLVSVDPSERPETWLVEFHTDDGVITALEGDRYGDFEGLYFKYPIQNLYSWCLPSGTGTVRVTGPDGSVEEIHHHGG